MNRLEPNTAKPLILQLIKSVSKQKLGSSSTTHSDFLFKEKAKHGTRDSHIKTTKGKKRKTRRLKGGRTTPSCKSNYAFYDSNESPMSTNKRSSKTEMKTEKRKRDVEM